MSILDLESQEEHTGNSRPTVPKKADVRVSQFADKKGIEKKEAYKVLLTFLLDEEGNISEEL